MIGEMFNARLTCAITTNQTTLPQQASRKQQTLEDKCFKCGKKVYVLQRQLLESRLYHRHCVREICQHEAVERTRQVNSIKSVCHVTAPSAQERERAREITITNINKLMTRGDSYRGSGKVHSHKQNTSSSSQKEASAMSSAPAQKHSSPLQKCPNTQLPATSSRKEGLEVNNESTLKFPTPNNTNQVSKQSFQEGKGSKEDIANDSKVEDSQTNSGLVNKHHHIKFPPLLPMHSGTPIRTKDAEKPETFLKSDDYNFSKPKNATLYSKPSKGEVAMNIQHHTTTSIYKISAPKHKDITTLQASADKTTASHTPRDPIKLNLMHVTSTDMMLASPIHCTLKKEKVAVGEKEGRQMEGKTEWQLEVERRVKLRGGVYEDPEFKVKRGQEDVPCDLKHLPDHNSSKGTLDSNSKTTEGFFSHSDAYAAGGKSSNSPKKMFDYSLCTDTSSETSTTTTTSTTTSKATSANFTNFIYSSNLTYSSIQTPRKPTTMATKLQENAGKEVVCKSEHPRKGLPITSSTPNPNLFPQSTPATAQTYTTPHSPYSFSSIYKAPIHLTLQTTTTSNVQTPAKSTLFSTTPQLAHSPSKQPTEAVTKATNNKAPSTTTHPPSTTTHPPSTTTHPPSTTTHPPSTTTHPPSTTTHPPSTTTTQTSSSLPLHTCSPPTLPSSLHTGTSACNLSFHQTLLTSPTMKDAVRKGVFVADSGVSVAKTHARHPVQMRDYIDVAKYQAQASTVSKRKVSSEMHIAYKEIDDRVERLLQEMLMVEEEGRQLEESIRHDEDDDKDDDDDDDDAMDTKMVQWLELVRRRNDLIRRENDLMHKRRQQEYDEVHEDLEYQLRILLAIPEKHKSAGDKHFEDFLMRELHKIVDCRNRVVEAIECDREQYLKEDEHLHCLSNSHARPITPVEEKKKKKSRKFKRLFKRKSSSHKQQSDRHDGVQDQIGMSSGAKAPSAKEKDRK